MIFDAICQAVSTGKEFRASFKRLELPAFTFRSRRPSVHPWENERTDNIVSAVCPRTVRGGERTKCLHYSCPARWNV